MQPKAPNVLPFPDTLYKESFAPDFKQDEWVPTQEQIDAYYRPITFWSDAATQKHTNVYSSNPVSGHLAGSFVKNTQFSTPVGNRMVV